MNSSSPPLSPPRTLQIAEGPVAPIVEDILTPPGSGITCRFDPLSVHGIEREVVKRLQNHPGLKFTRLDVHRCAEDAVYIEGFLESNDDQVDICEIVRGIQGIKNVVNRVVTARPAQTV